VRRIAVLAIILSFAACSESNRAGTVGTPDSKESAAPSDSLKAALLTIEDMPKGWMTDPPVGSSGIDMESGFCNKPIIRREDVPASVDVKFYRAAEKSTNVFLELLVSYESEQEASKAFEEIQQAARGCTRWETTDASSESEFTLESLSFPKQGDDTLAVRVSGKFTPKANPHILGTATGETIVLRKGKLIGVLVQAAIGFFQPPALESKEMESITRKAAEKL
jgi:hypothetical protein